MKYKLVFPRILVVWLFLSVAALSADQPKEIPLWPSVAPGSEGKTGKEAIRVTPDKEHVISNVHNPSLTPYLGTKSKTPRAAVIIIPGGGHREMWVDHEGHNLARWLSARGIAAFVLKYRLAREPNSTYTTFWSPDGARLAYNLRDESCWIIEVGKPWGEQTPQRVPNPPDGSGVFRAFSWSPDGRKLGGWINSPVENDGILVYTFETNNFERITDFGARPIWLHDSRRLLFRDAGKLFLVNSETKKVQEISLPSPQPVIEYGMTDNDRTLYYTLLSTEADIWLLNLE